MKRYSMMAVFILLNSFCIDKAQSSESAKIAGPDTGKNNQLVVEARDKDEDGWWSDQPKEKKMLYTNLTAAAAITAWGLATWDYGSSGFYTHDEGWFEQDSKYGGADKLGHFWATYTFADALTGLYKNWGLRFGQGKHLRGLVIMDCPGFHGSRRCDKRQPRIFLV